MTPIHLCACIVVGVACVYNDTCTSVYVYCCGCDVFTMTPVHLCSCIVVGMTCVYSDTCTSVYMYCCGCDVCLQ